MKTLFIVVFCIITSLSYGQTWKIYETHYGFKDLIPTQVIEYDVYTHSFDVYNVDFGFKELLPSFTIKQDLWGNYGIYDINYGFPSLTPQYIIEPQQFNYDFFKQNYLLH